MNRTLRTASAALGGIVALSGALSGCSGSSDAASASSSIDLVGFSVLEAANQPLIDAFEKTPDGKGVTFKTSYGASGDQSRAVEAGLGADVVHFSLEGDVTRLVDAGLVANDWNTGPRDPHPVHRVIVVKRQPEEHPGLGGPDQAGRRDRHPQPWLVRLRALEHPRGVRPHHRDRRLRRRRLGVPHELLRAHRRAADSGRDATTAFSGGTGDALISYENEAILARQKGDDFDYVVPDQTLIENPGAVTKDAPPVAQNGWTTSSARRARSSTPTSASVRWATSAASRSRAPTTRPTRSRSPRSADHRQGLRRLERRHRQVLRRGERSRHQDPG